MQVNQDCHQIIISTLDSEKSDGAYDLYKLDDNNTNFVAEEIVSKTDGQEMIKSGPRMITDDHGTISDPDYVPSEHSGSDSDVEQDSQMQLGRIQPNEGEIIVSEDQGSEEEQDDAGNHERQRTGRPKRGRKRKYGNLTRVERSKRKYKYEEYVNFSKKHMVVPQKVFIDVDCQCRNKCKDKICVADRQKEFEKFKSLGDYNAQNLYICNSVREVPKKRSYNSLIKTTGKARPKSCSRIYSLNKVVVCREMFAKTLLLSTKRINTALSKFKSESLLDQRGKQAGWNTMSEEKLNEIRKCIDAIPKYTSHYRRGETSALFLPPEMNINKMYELYVDGRSQNEVVSLSSFKKVFYTNYNLKFKSLKKDTCNKCDMFVAKLKSTQNEEEESKIQKEYDEHKLAAKTAMNRIKSDLKSAADNPSLECLTFDLQKTLPLPRIPTNIVFYKRQLWVYNCGIHTGKEDKGFCYTWVEGEAGRGAQEVSSAIIKHVQNKLPAGTESLILWSDSCGGQNRNIKVVLMLKALLHDHPTLKTITHRFPMPGHSFLPNDNDFGKIENALKYQQHVYCPDDYFTIMEKCKKQNPLTVVRMRSEDFKSSYSLEEAVTNRKKTVEKEDVSWLNTREILLKKEKPMSIFMSRKFDGPHEELDITKAQKKTKGRPSKDEPRSLRLADLQLLWPNGKPVAEAKLKDLKSMLHLLPKNYHGFYKSLYSSAEIEDDVDGFGGELDFEIEIDD
ncbi:uncharacterized protein LOC128991468 [Macrosteles quadrilineatus]|uniref:uncharacterized protein LOC128991468 n=1 Tax=Macrosteles quadrilineatus TaxID=74068 RepID=UPI0023E2F3A7|nr:uncharacterized protein LOC128991468 [Macrosteles quadrilineatus]